MALADTEALELGTAERCERWRESYKMQEQQLAAAQLEAKRLRESVDQYLIENDPSNFGCACDLSVGHLCGPCFAHKQQTVLRKALSSPTSTDALDAYAAEKQEIIQALSIGLDEKSEKISELTRQRDLAVSAMRGVVEWDKRRNFIVPYKVRDPLHAAIKESESPNKP